MARRWWTGLALALLALCLSAQPSMAAPERQSPGGSNIYFPTLLDESGATPAPTPGETGGPERVFGLLGYIYEAVGQRFGSYLITPDNQIYGLVGATSLIEEDIVALRGRATRTPVKVWGSILVESSAASFRMIVVSDITAVAEETATRPTTEPTPTAPAATATPEGVVGGPEPVATAVGKFDRVNLRSGPANSFPPVGQVTAGQVCSVIGRNGLMTWWLLDCAGVRGWMDGRLVELRGDTAAAPLVAAQVGESAAGQGGASPSTPTPSPTPTPLAPPEDAWTVTFYNNGRLRGSPVAQTRVNVLDLNWGLSSPFPGVPADDFSASFERLVNFPYGFYRFYAEADDGVRYYLDDIPIIDEWHGATGETYTAGRTLSGWHRLRVDYYEAGGQAAVRAGYNLLSNQPDWTATYYSGTDLNGRVLLQQPEPAGARRLDYVWGPGSPFPGTVPPDFWSARWEGDFAFEGGNYVFRANVDDGVRIYLNDILVIDSWRDGYRELSNRFIGIGRDTHTVRVEYYERTGNATLQVWWYRDSGGAFEE